MFSITIYGIYKLEINCLTLPCTIIRNAVNLRKTRWFNNVKFVMLAGIFQVTCEKLKSVCFYEHRFVY